ncbi:LAMI_0A07404g1_1 [Lachancea mirantina]|uniref:LAMI_0A07404g1_1 n=1 Tax=Lachancea mirantina TaxID=1230905 RepID=A0A1G4IQV6_9SACH|nr:LAMI_0A07404g1_1 [Lachancea mirantina]
MEARKNEPKRLYNDSITGAYGRLLSEASDHEISRQTGGETFTTVPGENQNAEDREYAHFRGSISRAWDTDSENDKDYDDDDDFEDGDYEEDGKYSGDTDYTEEADQSFFEDDGDAEDDDFLREDNRDAAGEEELWDGKVKFNNNRIGIIAFLLVAVVVILATVAPAPTVSESVPAGGQDSVAQLRLQVNRMYRELQEERKRVQNELDHAIQVVVSQVEKNVKKLASRDSEVAHDRPVVWSLNLKNITEWQETLIEGLAKVLPKHIPVLIDNTTEGVIVVPEMHTYLESAIPKIIEGAGRFADAVIRPLELDTTRYVRQVLQDELQYVDKTLFLQELNTGLHRSQREILEEVESELNRQLDLRMAGAVPPAPQQYSQAVQRRFFQRIYNSNVHQWQDDLDFGTASTGTRLLNHRCSATFKGTRNAAANGVTPFDLLADSYEHSSTYWLCRDVGRCSWAVRFAQPLFLTKLSYIHGRFTNNVHFMQAAPKKFSIYVEVQSPATATFVKAVEEANPEGMGTVQPVWERDGSFLFLGSYEYDVSSSEVRQHFPLPAWFVRLKPRVKSIAFEAGSNYGSKHYIALRKFIINGVTDADLSTDFDLHAAALPNYAGSERQQVLLSGLQKPVPALGEDEFDN